jgi:hypothetical protein
MLATKDDVKRWLKDPSANDADIEKYLEAASEWVKHVCKKDWDTSGTVTEKFYDVRQDSLLQLKDESPTAVVVKAFITADDLGVTLVANTSYDVQERGKIRLHYERYRTPEGFEEAVVEVPPGEWARIEVTYTAMGVVPPLVREAVAAIAATTYACSARDANRLASESLGDYSYSRAGDATIVIPPIATEYLGPYKKVHIRST